MTAKLGRVALGADIEAGVIDFSDLFEFAFRIADFPEQGLGAAIGGQGIGFVQMTALGCAPRAPA